MYYVYALKSTVQKYIYVGLTDNPKRRISQHNKGLSKSTKFYKPFNLILIEPFKTRFEARNREKYLKSGCGKEYLKSLKTIKPGW